MKTRSSSFSYLARCMPLGMLAFSLCAQAELDKTSRSCSDATLKTMEGFSVEINKKQVALENLDPDALCKQNLNSPLDGNDPSKKDQNGICKFSYAFLKHVAEKTKETITTFCNASKAELKHCEDINPNSREFYLCQASFLERESARQTELGNVLGHFPDRIRTKPDIKPGEQPGYLELVLNSRDNHAKYRVAFSSGDCKPKAGKPGECEVNTVDANCKPAASNPDKCKVSGLFKTSDISRNPRFPLTSDSERAAVATHLDEVLKEIDRLRKVLLESVHLASQQKQRLLNVVAAIKPQIEEAKTIAAKKTPLAQLVAANKQLPPGGSQITGNPQGGSKVPSQIQPGAGRAAGGEGLLGDQGMNQLSQAAAMAAPAIANAMKGSESKKAGGSEPASGIAMGATGKGDGTATKGTDEDAASPSSYLLSQTKIAEGSLSSSAPGNGVTGGSASNTKLAAASGTRSDLLNITGAAITPPGQIGVEAKSGPVGMGTVPLTGNAASSSLCQGAACPAETSARKESGSSSSGAVSSAGGLGPNRGTAPNGAQRPSADRIAELRARERQLQIEVQNGFKIPEFERAVTIHNSMIRETSEAASSGFTRPQAISVRGQAGKPNSNTLHSNAAGTEPRGTQPQRTLSTIATATLAARQKLQKNFGTLDTTLFERTHRALEGAQRAKRVRVTIR